VTYLSLPLAFPFYFTANGNLQVTSSQPIQQYVAVLRREDRTNTVLVDRLQVLKQQSRLISA